MTDDREHPRIVAERLGGGLSFLRVRLIVDHFRDDLSAEKAARGIPLVDCEIDRLTHLDAESRRGGRQRTGNADADFLAGEVDVPRARVRCAAVGCGFINTLVFYDRFAPPMIHTVREAGYRIEARSCS